MKKLRYTLAAFLGLLSFSAAVAQSDDAGWTLIREAEGIQIYSRPQGEGMIDEIKGLLVVTGDIDSAFKILSNLAVLSSTDPVVVETEVLHTVNENEYFVWQRAKMPFFMNDRDIVSKISFNRTAKGGYVLTGKSYGEYIPEKPKLVRMHDVSLVVALQPISATTFELFYRLHIGDTYGSVVTNAGNKAAAESTLERLKRMRNLTAAKPVVSN